MLVLLEWPQNVRTNIAYFITLLKTSLVQLALKEGGLKILRMRTEPNTEGERDLEADCGDKGTAKGRGGGLKNRDTSLPNLADNAGDQWHRQWKRGREGEEAHTHDKEGEGEREPE